MINPEHLLAEAKELDRIPAKTDVRRRTIIGRAYYAAFHCALNQSIGQAFEYDPALQNNRGRHIGRHRQLVKLLTSSQNRLVRNAGLKLNDLLDARVTADYKLDATIPLGHESTCVQLAEEIIKDDFARDS